MEVAAIARQMKELETRWLAHARVAAAARREMQLAVGDEGLVAGARQRLGDARREQSVIMRDIESLDDSLIA
jgi:hypothetical protein